MTHRARWVLRNTSEKLRTMENEIQAEIEDYRAKREALKNTLIIFLIESSQEILWKEVKEEEE